MLDWMQILKLDQVSIGSTKLDTRQLPEEEPERNCCLEAAEKYVSKKEELYDYKQEHRKEVIESWCRSYFTEQLLKNILCVSPYTRPSSDKLKELDDYGLKICQEWEECEGE